MSTEVQALESADIDRSGSGASVGGEQQQQQQQGGGHVEAPAMGADQQAALKEVDRLRNEYGNTPSDKRDALMQRMSKLSRFAHGIDEKPSDFLPGDLPPPDNRPHDSLRTEFEKGLQPATALQTKALVNGAVMQGVDRVLAQSTADICAALDLGEVQTKIMFDRVRQHHGTSHEFTPDKDIRVLDDAGIAEYSGEAARLYGSAEKFQAASERARDFLAHKGALEILDKRGLTRSSLAFDPRVLNLLAFAADAAGVPKRGRK